MIQLVAPSEKVNQILGHRERWRGWTSGGQRVFFKEEATENGLHLETLSDRDTKT